MALSHIEQHYNKHPEDLRLLRRHGQVEFETTMHHLRRFLKPGCKVLDIGAGTGRYASALMSEGYSVKAVELVRRNIEVFKKRTPEADVVQGDARDLSFLPDATADVTLLLGPLYHLTTDDDKLLALREARRVTRPGGVIFVAYLMNEYSILSYCFDEDRIETLFELVVTNDYNLQRNGLGYFCNASGYPECSVNTDSKLYKYFDATPGDVRSELIQYQTSSKTKAYFPAKYPGRGGEIYLNNPKIIRLSEVYLIAAEASVMLGNNADAADYINAIEQNRVDNYTAVSSADIDDVIWEYEKEFFAENQIAFAYWRNKKSVVNQVGKTIDYNDNRTILPLPQREIDYNPALKQNAGY